MGRQLAIGTLLVALVGIVPCARAEEARTLGAPSLDEILAREVTPGTLGLMIESPRNPRVHAVIVAALRDERADVRAAAARMVYVTRLESAAADLRAAFDAESSASAASEQVAALLLLSPADEETVLRRAAQVDRFVLEQAGRKLALLRPAALVSRLPLLSELGLGEAAQREALEIAILGNPAATEELGRSILQRGDAYSWGFYLGAFEHAGLPPPAALLAAALGKPSTKVSTLYWMAAGAWWKGGEKDALARALGALPARETLEGWLVEIVRRQGGLHSTSLTGRVAETDADKLGPLVMKSKVRRVLTIEERARLGQALYGDPLWLVADPGWPEFAALAQPGPELVAALPTGFVASVVTEAGCEAREGELMAARAGFDERGVPQTVERVGTSAGISAECDRAGSAVLWAHVSGLPRPATNVTVLVLSLEPEATSCSLQAEKKTRDIAEVWGKKPIEPLEIQSPGAVDGMRRPPKVAVAIEVGSDGCVRSAVPAKGAMSRAAVEALRTVAAWRYARYTAEGKPVTFRTVGNVVWK